MGYLFILLALSAGAVKAYCGKKTSGHMVEQRVAMLISFVRMTICALFGGVIILVSGDFAALSFDSETLLISALSGVANALFVSTWLMAVRKGAYMLVEIFLTLGTFVAIGCSAVFYNEAVSLRQVIGLVGLVCAVILMCSYNNSIKEKITFSAVLILMACGLSSGLADFSQKMFVKTCSGVPVSVFNFYTYVFSSATLLVIYFALLPAEKNKAERKPIGPIIRGIAVYLTVMAVCLYLNSYFKTKAAAVFPAPQLYSMLLGGSLIAGTAMSSVLFKEKITIKSLAGIALAFVSLLLINL